MKFRTETAPTTERTSVGTGATIAPVALRNNPVEVTMTVQMRGFAPIIVDFEDENECRNLIVRMVPERLLASAPEEVMKHITGDLDPMFKVLLETAQAMGLALPTIPTVG